MQDLQKEVARLKRILAPNEDPNVTRLLRSFFQSNSAQMTMDRYAYTGREGDRCYKMSQRDVANEVGLGHDQPTIYLVGQSLSLLGWRKVLIDGKVFYKISAEDYDNEFLPTM